MKNKISVIIILIAITSLSLTGCNKYEKDESYSTDLYGCYSYQIGSKESSYFLKYEYIFNKNNTYNYRSSEIQYGEETNDASNDGEISFCEISDEIIEINLDSEILYKYKNMIGDLYKIEVPSEKTFDLVVSTPNENWTGSYPNAGYIFNKEGTYHSCLDTTNCNDTQEKHSGIYYKYICKNDIIYFIDPNMENMSYQILYYITDEGLFFPELYKTN